MSTSGVDHAPRRARSEVFAAVSVAGTGRDSWLPNRRRTYVRWQTDGQRRRAHTEISSCREASPSRNLKVALPPAENRLIQRLPRRERLRFLAECTSVELTLADVLHEAGKPARHVYFPATGFVSLIVETPTSPGLEVGMVGNEGMVGVHVSLGVSRAPLRSVVQGAGTALRIGGAAFRAQLKSCPTLHREMDRYIYVLMTQLALSAACLRFHEIGPRLARWLLMSQDRAGGDRFRMTHEFLAYMLGVRRVGITAAAGALQRSGVISYRRGDLIVLDRGKLEASACACYASGEGAYDALLPP